MGANGINFDEQLNCYISLTSMSGMHFSFSYLEGVSNVLAYFITTLELNHIHVILRITVSMMASNCTSKVPFQMTMISSS
jgi:hypothetical protein